MKQCKCDQCEVTYSPQIHGCGTLQVEVNDSNHRSWASPFEVDLCPKCMKKMDRLVTEALRTK